MCLRFIPQRSHDYRIGNFIDSLWCSRQTALERLAQTRLVSPYLAHHELDSEFIVANGLIRQSNLHISCLPDKQRQWNY